MLSLLLRPSFCLHSSLLSSPSLLPAITTTSVRSVWGTEHRMPRRSRRRPNRHVDDGEWKKMRQDKIFKVNLPDYEFHRRLANKTASPAELRDHLVGMGKQTVRKLFTEKPLYVSCTGGFAEEYVAPEGDGKASIVSKEGAKQTALTGQRKGKTMLAVRKIRKFDEDFDPRKFVEKAQEVYIKAHEALAKRQLDGLLEFVTEKAYPELLHNISRKTIYWQFIKSLEPSRAVHVRTVDVIAKDNIFAQVTVRMNTQQILAVYDRFGRLLHGSPTVAKDTLEYVVFEKHLANVYGQWRLHGKIIPDWMEDKAVSKGTYVVHDEIEEVVPEAEKEAVAEAAVAAEKKEEEEAKEGETTLYDRFGRAIGRHRD